MDMFAFGLILYCSLEGPLRPGYTAEENTWEPRKFLDDCQVGTNLRERGICEQAIMQMEAAAMMNL